MIDNFKMICAGGDKHEEGVGLLLYNNIAKCMLGCLNVNERLGTGM